jgi:hypothetical protein
MPTETGSSDSHNVLALDVVSLPSNAIHCATGIILKHKHVPAASDEEKHGEQKWVDEEQGRIFRLREGLRSTGPAGTTGTTGRARLSAGAATRRHGASSESW